MKKLLWPSLLSVFFTAPLSAQSWSGFRFGVEPTIASFFGNGREVGQIWHYEKSGALTNGIPTLNYGMSYRPIFLEDGSDLGWQFDLMMRPKNSRMAYGLKLFIFNSHGLTGDSALNPPDAFYEESCRIFGQTILPLTNEDRPSGLTSAYCGGENVTKISDGRIFLERVFYESSNAGIYGSLAFSYGHFSNSDHIWMRQTAVVHNYFSVGGDFVNEVFLDSYGRSRAVVFGPVLGVRGNLKKGLFVIEGGIEQSVRAGKFLVDRVVWTDIDDIQVRVNGEMGPTQLYMSGRFVREPMTEKALVFGAGGNLRLILHPSSFLSFGVNVFCSHLGSLPIPARWDVPSDWGVLQGTGWKEGEKQSIGLCGISPSIRLLI